MTSPPPADGPALIALTGFGLIGGGLIAFALGATGYFLPHDLAYLGTDAADLWAVADSRLALFLIHDRVSFGGAVLGIGVLYCYLAAVPLRRGEGWAWWAVAVSAAVGYGGFALYLGGGYFDSWRWAASLALLPPVVLGLAFSKPRGEPLPTLRIVFLTNWPSPRGGAVAVGRLLLAMTACCLVIGGAIIAGCGMTTVFVPQDLDYLAVTPAEICAWNPRAVPLIAHDRAGFGSAVASCGTALLPCALHGRITAAWWWALAVTGGAGFGAGILVHLPIGYLSLTHLAPAVFGAGLFLAGLGLTYPGSARSRATSAAHSASSGESGGKTFAGSAYRFRRANGPSS